MERQEFKRVEAWSDDRLNPLWEQTSAPEPTPEVWTDLFERIERAMSSEEGPGTSASCTPRRTPNHWRLGLLTAAAALLLLVVGQLTLQGYFQRFLGQKQASPEQANPRHPLEPPVQKALLPQNTQPRNDSLVQQPGEEQFIDAHPDKPFEVVDASEVVIISMDVADVDAVLVGESPVDFPLVLASQGDIQIDQMGIASSELPGYQPYLHQPENGPPMLTTRPAK